MAYTSQKSKATFYADAVNLLLVASQALKYLDVKCAVVSILHTLVISRYFDASVCVTSYWLK